MQVFCWYTSLTTEHRVWDIASEIAGNQLFIQRLAPGKKQWKHESSSLRVLCEDKSPVTDLFPHKEPIMWKTFLGHHDSGQQDKWLKPEMWSQ